jgi:hypothetical protein
MKITIFKSGTIGAGAVAMLFAASASAIPIYTGGSPFGLNTPGVVGAVFDGSPASVADEVGYINHLLGITGLNQDVTLGGHEYLTGVYDYSGFVSDGVKTESGNFVPSGSDFVLAKYGENDVVFYLGGNSVTLPLDGSSLIMNKPGNSGLGLSHFTTFGVAVPDGGATVGLLGFGLLGLAMLRKKLK